jgi:hypothetical protein
MTPHLKKL